MIIQGEKNKMTMLDMSIVDVYRQIKIFYEAPNRAKSEMKISKKAKQTVRIEYRDAVNQNAPYIGVFGTEDGFIIENDNNKCKFYITFSEFGNRISMESILGGNFDGHYGTLENVINKAYSAPKEQKEKYRLNDRVFNNLKVLGDALGALIEI